MKRIHIFVILTLAFGGRRLYSHEFSSGQQVSDYASGIGPVREKRKAACGVHGWLLQI